MTRPRIHIPADRWQSCLALLEPERRHLVSVLRLGAGTRVEVFDGQGHVCQAVLSCQDGEWLLRLGSRRSHQETFHKVDLGIALLKGKKLDAIVRMITEVGVSSIRPFTCSRSVPRADPRRIQERVRRWQTIASQGARQSGRSHVPCVHTPVALQELLTDETARFRAILHESAGGPVFTQILEAAGPDRLILVGPEGGFTPEEIEEAGRRGFRVARMGLPVLRAETAAVVASALACLDMVDRKSSVE